MDKMDTHASVVIAQQRALHNVAVVAIDPASDLLLSTFTDAGHSRPRQVDPSCVQQEAMHHSSIVTINTLEADLFPTMRTTDPAIATGHDSGSAKIKVSKKKCLPSSSVCHEKLQKMDLSLETYVQVLLSVEQGLQFLDKSCSLQSLRKVLTANSFSTNKLSKEFITLHIQQLPLFKPFLSSLGCTDYKDLQVSAMAINHNEVVEDLNALEWLEYGRVHVVPEAECILGMSAEERSWRLSSACCPKRDSCSFKSHVANPTLPSGNDQQCKRSYDYDTHEAVNTGPQVATTECSNVTEVLCLTDGYNCHKHAESLSSYGSNGISLERESSSGFRSAMPNASATLGCKIRQKAGRGMEGVSIEFDPPQFAASASRPEAEQTSRPSAAQINTGRDVQRAGICPSVTQINVGRVLDVTRQKSQLALRETQSQDSSYNSFKELVSTKIKSQRRENALICSSESASAHIENYERNLSYLSESRKGENAPTMSCSTLLLDEPASQISQPDDIKNLNRRELRGVVASNTQSSPISDMAADHELVELSCSQNWNRKEVGNAAANNIQSASFNMMACKLAEYRFQDYQLGRAEKENGKELQSKEAATCKSPTHLDFSSDCSKTEMVNAANVSSTSHLSAAEQVNPDVEVTADGNEQERTNLRPTLAKEASHIFNRAPTPQMGNFDAASAGFLDVLSDAASSTLDSNNIEDSLDLLERWQKRRHRESSDQMTAEKSSKVHRIAGIASNKATEYLS